MTIVFKGGSGGSVNFSSQSPSTITLGGGASGATAITSHQRAQMAGYTGTESEFYTEIAGIVDVGVIARDSAILQLFNRTLMVSGFALPGDGIRLQNGSTVTVPSGAADGSEIVLSVEGQPGSFTDGSASELLGLGIYTLKKTPNGWEAINHAGPGFMKYQSA